jgi:hypothetical protein
LYGFVLSEESTWASTLRKCIGDTVCLRVVDVSPLPLRKVRKAYLYAWDDEDVRVRSDETDV